MIFHDDTSAAAIPSPLHMLLAATDNDDNDADDDDNITDKQQKSLYCAVPHVLISCKRETFGIPLLDTFFCSKQYAQCYSERYQIATRYVEIDHVDHWTILSSQRLRTVLRDELNWIRSIVEGGKY